MQVLEFLRGAVELEPVDQQHASIKTAKNRVVVEYRLLCSGSLRPAGLQGDPSRSDVARVLLFRPVQLVVASRPYDEYPQELSLRFVMDLDCLTNAGAYGQTPDSEIASDIAAILSLLCRRLITVCGKVRMQFDSTQMPEPLRDYPCPVSGRFAELHWPRRPVWAVEGKSGVTYVDTNPPSVEIDFGFIEDILLSLPTLEHATPIVLASRLYTTALAEILLPPDNSYQLLVAAAEAVSGAVCKDHRPADPEIIQIKNELIKHMVEVVGIERSDAEKVAIKSADRDSWTARKLKRFVELHCDFERMSTRDDLFDIPAQISPSTPAGVATAIGKVYRARSSLTHAGKPYPPSAGVGTYSTWGSEVLDALVGGEVAVPPVGWFERVLNLSIVGYIQSQLASIQKPSPAGA